MSYCSYYCAHCGGDESVERSPADCFRSATKEARSYVKKMIWSRFVKASEVVLRGAETATDTPPPTSACLACARRVVPRLRTPCVTVSKVRLKVYTPYDDGDVGR